MVTRRYYNSMYGFYFHIADGKKEEIHKKYPDARFNGLGACVLYQGENGAIKILTAFNHGSPSFGLDVIVHECGHAALWACQAYGIKPDPDNDEPLQYMLEWFCRKCFAFYGINQIKLGPV